MFSLFDFLSTADVLTEKEKMNLSAFTKLKCFLLFTLI